MSNWISRSGGMSLESCRMRLERWLKSALSARLSFRWQTLSHRHVGRIQGGSEHRTSGFRTTPHDVFGFPLFKSAGHHYTQVQSPCPGDRTALLQWPKQSPLTSSSANMLPRQTFWMITVAESLFLRFSTLEGSFRHFRSRCSHWLDLLRAVLPPAFLSLQIR